MISRLRGTPAGKTQEGLVLDVGGVGYLVAATPSALRKADAARSHAAGDLAAGDHAAGEVVIDTFLHVREDALQLYGFGDTSERELFVRLLGVSGIGPKVALGVVSSGAPGDLRKAIVAGDAVRFQAIPGIGKKTAERIVLELRGSISEAAEPGATGTTAELVARDALVELGYSVVEAERVLADVDPELPAEERIRQALRTAA
jgi:Holliday junction DNA helicase RuvA